jgi:DeoR family fructose operon transcriptional repressor
MITNAPQRQRRILDLLEHQPSYSTSALPEELGVTPMTVWRDLKSLEEKGLIRRLHGRIVGKKESEAEPDFLSKRTRNRQGKEAIAKHAVSALIQEGDCIALDGGTTVAAMARQILPSGVTIVTNSLHTAQSFQDHPSRPVVYCCGGLLREASGTFIGREALSFFSKRRFQHYFLSATGVEAEAGITDLTLEDNEVKRAMASASEEVVLMADCSKIGIISHMQVLPWRRIHHFITDATPDEVIPIQKRATPELSCHTV